MLDRIVDRLGDCPPAPVQPLGAEREAAVLVALTRERHSHIVLIKRAAHLTKHGGEVAFPGGMWEPGDASLLGTALRETEEEIALPAGEVEVIARLPRQVTRTAVQVTPYVGLFDPIIELSPDLAELDAVFRVPIAHLLELDNFVTREFELSGVTYALPCCLFEGYQIWGFTLRVLVKFLNQTLGAGLELDYDDIGGSSGGSTDLPNFGGMIR
jgi:8-oxo-dGTP pyrophosphatase MutT (NUDIX family)